MRRSSRFVLLTTTLARRSEATALARALVEARLAACAQCEPIRSLYRWKGRLETATEVRLTAKTRAALAARAVAFVRARHPYEVPEIVVTPIVAGLEAYLDWIAAETRPAPAAKHPTRGRRRR